MARKPRIHYPGALYHVMLRGNAKQVIFHEKREIKRFEEILSQGLEECSMRLYAYCWMKNHVHMALQVADIRLSKMMQSLSQRYTGWFNYRYDRVGHLFQGRYKAILVDKQGYLRELIRYIHLNPVRAELVASPAEYEDSSHNAYLLPGRAPEWLSIDPALKLFGHTEQEARKNYLYFMGQPEKTEDQELLRKGRTQGRILGNDDFVDRIQKQAGVPKKVSMTLEELTCWVADQVNVPRHSITVGSRIRSVSEVRAIVALLSVDCLHKSLTDVSTYFERDLASMSRRLKNLRNKMAGNSDVREKVQEMVDKIRSKLQA